MNVYYDLMTSTKVTELKLQNLFQNLLFAQTQADVYVFSNIFLFAVYSNEFLGFCDNFLEPKRTQLTFLPRSSKFNLAVIDRVMSSN